MKVYDEKIALEKDKMVTHGKVEAGDNEMRFLEERLFWEIKLYDWIVERFWKHLRLLRVINETKLKKNTKNEKKR